jgi:hypothetical protein
MPRRYRLEALVPPTLLQATKRPHSGNTARPTNLDFRSMRGNPQKVASYSVTVTVAVMLGWILQWYGNVPTVSNVYEYVWPWLRCALCGPAGLPVPVTVCAVLSLLVQVTVVPFLTVIAAGENAKFSMVTLLVAAGVVVVLVLFGVVIFGMAVLWELLEVLGVGVVLWFWL